jgi:hypothetical protein
LDNDELVAQLEDIKATLNRVADLLTGQIMIAEAADRARERQNEMDRRVGEVIRLHEVTAETALQGYLSGRWKRRDGTIVPEA